jgi:small GTP-binding protein
MTMRGKVVFVGDAGVGKTAIFRRFKHGKLPQTTPTIGAISLACSVPLCSGETIALNVWDTAGQDDFRSLVPMFIRGAEVAVVVFDVSRRCTFSSISDWISLFDQENCGCHIFIVGNKTDLESKVEASDVEDFCERHGHLPHFLTSAVTGDGIDLLFRGIAERVVKNESCHCNTMYAIPSINLSSHAAPSKRDCC